MEGPHSQSAQRTQPPASHQERAEQALDERDYVERRLVTRGREAAREAPGHAREASLACELPRVHRSGVDAHGVEVHQRAHEDEGVELQGGTEGRVSWRCS